MIVGPPRATSWPIGCGRPLGCSARTGVGARPGRTRARHRGPHRHRAGLAAPPASAQAGYGGAGCRPGELTKLQSCDAILNSNMPITHVFSIIYGDSIFKSGEVGLSQPAQREGGRRRVRDFARLGAALDAARGTRPRPAQGGFEHERAAGTGQAAAREPTFVCGAEDPVLSPACSPQPMGVAVILIALAAWERISGRPMRATIRHQIQTIAQRSDRRIRDRGPLPNRVRHQESSCGWSVCSFCPCIGLRI